MRWNRIILIACLALITSCVERFIPETTGYAKVLFIECLISDDTASRPEVHISLSAPIVSESGGRLTYKPEGVSNAFARIDCSDGTGFTCGEVAPGTYRFPDEFRPASGKSYRLTVIVDNNTYESDYQELQQSTPIDSISCKHILQKRSEDGLVIDGYRFYASTHAGGTGPSYYRWTMDATFRYQVPYLATHQWNGRTNVVASNRLIRDCWKSKNINGIFIANTKGLTENRIVEAPLNFESQYGDELTIRYSLNVRQYTINQSANDFWENITKLVSQTGSLYETQPFRIEGNIHCTSDPAVYVAGIFEVAGVSVRRVFVDRPADFPVVPVECILMQVGTRDFPWYRLPAGSFVTEQSPNVFMTASPSCYDCRLRDGTLEKPPFWEDKYDKWP